MERLKEAHYIMTTTVRDIIEVLELNPDDLSEMTGIPEEIIQAAMDKEPMPEEISRILKARFHITDPNFKW